MPGSGNGKSPTILNVDADEASRFVVTQILQKAGFRIREATTAAEALTAAAEGPDLIVLDLHLPDASGSEVCRRLKADLATAPIPVLILSGECKDSRCRVAGFEAGAEACFARPVAADELVAQARTLLRLRRAEQQLRERAEEVEKLLDVLPVPVWIAHDPACRSMTGNRTSYEFLNLPPQTNVSVTAPADERPAIRHFRDGQEIPPGELPMQYAAAHGVEVRDAEFDFLLHSGATKHVYGSAKPLLDATGQVRGCVGVFMDLTERRRVEEALQASERRFKTLAGSAPVGIFETDAEGNCLFVNDRWCRMAGMTPDAARGQGWAEALHPEDRDRIFREWYTAAKEGREFAGEYRFRTPQGEVTWLSGSAVALRDESGRISGYIGTITDINARKQIEIALRESEERFRLLAKAANDGFWDLDLTTGRVWWNDAFDRLYGPRPADSGDTMAWWAERLHADDRDRVLQSLRKAIDSNAERWAEEYRFRRADGSYAYVLDRGFISRDETGRAIRFAGAMLDLTDRKRAEAELREADKRKDEFLATLAHELRNPLSPIRNAVQILKAEGSTDPKQVWARGVIDRQVEQMARLLDDLLDVSRISRGKLQLRKERVELATVVRSAVETSHPHITEMGHELTITLPKQPVVIEADLSRLAQVFLNLLTNAARYTDKGGRIWLTAERLGSDVVVSVKDTGIGVPADQLPRIFEMFTQVNHSAERSQGGLGIGLSLVRGLVEMHGGSIEARSEGPGRGSEFVVRLPVVVEASGLTAAGDAEEQPAVKSSLHILIVDDNRDGADSLSMMLRIKGNDTRTAYDGEEALAVAAEFRPEVILLDIGLPKLSGYEACRRIREQPWGKPMVIIAQTGWGQEEDRRRTHEAGFDHHMVKPVDPQALLKLLVGLKTN